MRINDKLNITRKKDNTNTFVIEVEGKTYNVKLDSAEGPQIEEIYNTCRQRSVDNRADYYETLVNNGVFPSINGLLSITEELNKTLTPEQKVAQGLQNIMNFFTEFQFEPNFRFINTLSRSLKGSKKKAKEYVSEYFELIDSPYCNDINEKIKSEEFNHILEDLKEISPTHNVNNRFKLYYGSQGTGKTTIAQKETENRCVVCNSSMLPADLMEDFVFADGKANFQKSMLWNCMENGKPLVMDEINLLPFDSLRFLQGILDGKKEFQYKGITVTINEGFKIIGTMNLTVNGMTYGLPEPLVDRCEEMKKFNLSAEDLLKAII